MIRSFHSTSPPAVEQTAIFAQRHELLAGDRSHLDTPDYRAKDRRKVDRFQEALADSIEAAPSPSSGYALPTLTTDSSPLRMPKATGQPLRKSGGGDCATSAKGCSAGVRDDFAVGPRQAMKPFVLRDRGMQTLAIATMRSQLGLPRAAITERA